MDLNKVMIIGNITRTPEVRVTPQAQQVCTFGVATNQQWTDSNGEKKQRTEFHNLVTWGKLAEICGQFLAKGSKIFGEGRLQTREWDDKDGNKRVRTEIILENMIMLDKLGARNQEKSPVDQFVADSISKDKEAYMPPMNVDPEKLNDIPQSTISQGAVAKEIDLSDIPF